ncbi:MAG: hypothetical protein IPP81_12720 [Chitinophagaceae bacterium]|nr:hypothetical protein [Chitinophagaceae bacterium]
MEQTNTPKTAASKHSGKSAKFNPKDYITILVAALLLIAGIVISIWKDFEIELIAFIFIAFSFGLLSFLMIGKIGTNNLSFAGIKISQASGGFLVFILILTSFLGYKKLTSKAALENSIQIENPRNTSIWKDASGVFEWFNPPLTYASDLHLKTKINWFNNDEFKLRILLIESEDSTENSDKFIKRLVNLQLFIANLSDKYKSEFKFDKHIEVRICMEKYIPTGSFFTTDKWRNKNTPRSIFYLPLKDNIWEPSQCIVSSSSDFYKTLHDEFQRHWGENDAQKISLDKLLNTTITEKTTRSLLK